MTDERAYRLGEYRITVHDDILVRWERHVPLGISRTGKCFLYGDVLIIGKKSCDENGFLIGEFDAKLRQLPPWTRTRYYCHGADLIDTVTGRNLTDEGLEQFSSFADKDRVVLQTTAIQQGSRRLGNYRILMLEDGRLSWQSSGAMDRIISGQCRVESGVLVIDFPDHDEAGKGKQEFLDSLSGLETWDKTRFWCRGPVLRSCAKGKQEEDSGIISRLRDTWQEHTIGNGPSPQRAGDEPKLNPRRHTAGGDRFAETAKRIKVSAANAAKDAWQRVAGKTSLLRCLTLFIATLVSIGLTTALYIAHEGVPWMHVHKKHHKHHER